MLIRKLISPDHLYHRRTKFTLSSYFQPFDTIPHNQTNPGGGPEESVSARLMTSYGVVRPAGPGTFHLLPLGLRAQNKLEALIDRELEVAGCQKISMPHLTPASLWRTSGRLEMMGSELMRLRDRQERPLVLAPTHEEAVTNILASLPVTSERDLPVKLYQIGTKFRDEMRPKFGLLRANEFRMQDLYTFDRDLRAAEETYQVVSEAYQRIFARLEFPGSGCEVTVAPWEARSLTSIISRPTSARTLWCSVRNVGAEPTWSWERPRSAQYRSRAVVEPRSPPGVSRWLTPFYWGRNTASRPRPPSGQSGVRVCPCRWDVLVSESPGCWPPVWRFSPRPPSSGGPAPSPPSA